MNDDSMSARMDFRGWYESNYPQLEKNGIWLRGGELNTIAPDEWERRQFRVLFARLSTYADTANSFTHLFLYQLAKRLSGVYPDLAYLPPKADLELFARDGVPWLLGTQSKRGPLDFDVIAFSNSIAQELLNLPAFLSKSGIPLEKKKRLARPELPLVLMGGANALYSSAVTLGEPLVDGVFVGESPDHIRRLLEVCREAKKQKTPKAEILTRLEEVPGFFQPDGSRTTRKSFVFNLDQTEALEDAPVPFVAERAGTANLQISEGCPSFCSFCAESWDRKPYRERSARCLSEIGLRAKAAMGLDEIDVFSFNFNMHSGIYQVLWDLVPRFRNIGLMSQRFDLLAHDRAMVEVQHAVGKSSFTCGLEGISPRLRRLLHKNLASEELHQSLGAIFKAKARELKIFTIATGYEEDQDFVALADLLDHLKSVRQSLHSGTRIIFSMTPLVRFPWTPLEFDDAPEMARYASIINRASKIVRAAGFEFRESAELADYWVSQVLVRADRPGVRDALVEASCRTGFVYYRDIPGWFRDAFEAELLARGETPSRLLSGFGLGESAGKPWLRVDTGVKREFLWEEFQRARQYQEIDYCLGRGWVKAKCFHCGGCPTRQHTRDIVLSNQKRSYSLDELKARVRLVRESERETCLRVTAGSQARGVSRKLLAVAVARALMLTEPRLTAHYRGYRGAFWADEDRPVWVEGEDLLRLVWLEAGVPILKGLLCNPAALEQVNRELGSWGALAGEGAAAWRPEWLELDSPYSCSPEAYLGNLGLKHVLRKTGEGAYRYELVPQSVKKGIVADLERQVKPDGGSICRIRLGPKFTTAMAQEFAAKAFRQAPGPAGPFHWVRTVIRSR